MQESEESVDALLEMSRVLCELRQEWQPGHQFNYPIVNAKACGSCLSIMSGLIRSEEFIQVVGNILADALKSVADERNVG